MVLKESAKKHKSDSWLLILAIAFSFLNQCIRVQNNGF